ncbi:MAG: hypothetical protein ACHREM_28365 [Polyangiales bacterium]
MASRKALGALSVVGPLAVMSGCSDLSRFSTDTDDSYCGQVITAGFVRAGVLDGATMRLQLDAAQLQTAPGTLWVSSALGNAGLATAVPIEPIPQLFNDPLSSLTFGEGRVANSLDVIHVGGVEIMVVLSLLQSGNVEVRLMHGSPASQTATNGQDAQIFGVFQLQKKRGDCSTP